MAVITITREYGSGGGTRSSCCSYEVTTPLFPATFEHTASATRRESNRRSSSLKAAVSNGEWPFLTKITSD